MSPTRIVVPALLLSNLAAFTVAGCLWMNHNQKHADTSMVEYDQYTLNENGRPKECGWLLEHSTSSETLTRRQLFDLSYCRALFIKENDMHDPNSCTLFRYFAADAGYDWDLEKTLGNHCRFSF